MATEAPTKPKKETWRDWLPPGTPDPEPLLTREELLTRLRKAGVKADEGDLRFWEYHGVLPRAIKKWHDGANRVFYPRWMIHMVALLRAYQTIGLPLRDIAPRLKQRAAGAKRMVEDFEERFGYRADQADHAEFGDDAIVWVASLVIAEFLQTEINAVARKYEALVAARDGGKVASVQIAFVDNREQVLDKFKVYVTSATE